MLADDEITVTLGKLVIRLRPTLKAAMRLHRAHGGFDKIIEAIIAENVSVMASVIREGEDGHAYLNEIIANIAGLGAYIAVETLKAPLITFVLQLAGHDDHEADDEQKGEPIPFEVHHKKLFQIATGWLLWTPEVAWSSTPSEITEAFKGRVECLKAIYGSGETNEAPEGEQSADEFNGKLSFFLAQTTARFAAAEKTV